MSSTNKNQNNGAVPKEVLEELRDGLDPSWTTVWEQAGTAGKTDIEVTPAETEEALKNVHRHMDSGRTDQKNISGYIHRYSRYFVAALALIALSTFFLFVPRTVTAPYGEMATLELPDGSTVEMNSGATIRYSWFYRFTNRNLELNGEAFFSVEDHAHPFIVDANGASVEVAGTQFNIRSWNNDPSQETTVTVSAGRVYFYPKQQELHRISLSAGETSRWNPGLKAPAPAETVNVGDVTAWRDQRFVFRDRTLISILDELERRYDTRIDLDAEGVELSTLTAYYSEHVQLESVLDDICTVKGLRYARTANGYRIFE